MPQAKNMEYRVRPRELRELLEEYNSVVASRKSKCLPTQREINHCIDLIPSATLPNKVAYKCTPEQNVELEREIEEFFTKGFIRKSVSPCALPIVLSPKKKGTWRLCMESRAINKIAIRHRFPMSRIQDLLDCLADASHYSKMDLKSDYH